MDIDTARVATSNRQRVLHALRERCADTGVAMRAGDLAAVLHAGEAPIAASSVVSALLSLVETQHVRVAGMTFGLRSGGRRLYWPTSAPEPARLPPPTTELAALFALLCEQRAWRVGVSFTGADAYAALRQVWPTASWASTYRCLRNLERRRVPLVQRSKDDGGRVTWRVLVDENSPRQRQETRARGGPAGRSSSEIALVAGQVAPMSESGGVYVALAQWIRQRRTPLVSVPALLTTADDLTTRDRWRRELDEVLRGRTVQQGAGPGDQTNSRRRRDASDSAPGQRDRICVVGRLERTLFVTLRGYETRAAARLRAAEIVGLASVLSRYAARRVAAWYRLVHERRLHREWEVVRRRAHTVQVQLRQYIALAAREEWGHHERAALVSVKQQIDQLTRRLAKWSRATP